MKYRVAITTKKGEIKSKNVCSKDKAEEWILEQMEKEEVKKSIIVNRKDISEREVENYE